VAGRAFGVDLEAEFPFPGLCAGVAPATGDPVQLCIAPRAELRRGWPGGHVVADHRAPDGRTVLRIEAGDAGFQFTFRGWGLFRISSDGRCVVCAPVRMATWRWQRYLVGQLLPFVSVLHGYEVFHASVVTRESRTLALIGASGAGKSSLATALLLRGWRLVADDVLVAEATTDGQVVAHVSTSLTNLRLDAAQRLSPVEIERLGRILGRDHESLRILTPTSGGAHRLTDLIVLERADQGGPVEPLRAIDPKLLLASTFNFIVQNPERLVRQLDMCHRIATTVEIARAVVTGEHGPAALAEHIERHVQRSAGTVTNP
jgi:hypothetical protein